MKKVLIIGTQHKPIPPVEGGAIQFLIDQYIKHNSISSKYEIVLYSPINKLVPNTQGYNNVEFRYIYSNKYKFHLKNYYYKFKNILFNNNLNSSIYCHEVINDLTKRKELNKYELIIIENQIESITTYKKFLTGKIVEHLHNDYLNQNTKNAKKIIDACDEIWCVSNFLSNQIRIIDNSAKTKVLYNGVKNDLINFNLSKEEFIDIRNELNIKENDTVFLYTGRIYKGKGVLELVKSFSKFSENKDDVKLLIIGDIRRDNNIDTDYLKEVKKYSNSNVIFTGHIPYESINKYYAISNIQVIPTLIEEAFGLVLIEGVMAKNALIVTNSGGIPELVDNNKAIIINKNNIYSELIDAMNKLYNNKDYQNKLIENSQEILTKFTIDNYNNNFDNYISSILER